MDIVRIVDAAIERLPTGQHTTGLVAVRRHIAAAIRHYEREDDGGLDSFTDSIYRTNQAFEGGLKEAYRVLANKDPSKLTPYQIETYLEENKLIRPRALKQLTRYREDYRNPSSHDYKLDFDADESLLAVVSVCAFTKLLINQIAAKLAYETARKIDTAQGPLNAATLDELAREVAKTLSIALPSLIDRADIETDELDGFIDGVLTKIGLETNLLIGDEAVSPEGEPAWSNRTSHSGFMLPIEARVIQDSSLEVSFEWLERSQLTSDIDASVMVIVDRNALDNYDVSFIKFKSGQGTYAVIPSNTSPALKKVLEGVAELQTPIIARNHSVRKKATNS